MSKEYKLYLQRRDTVSYSREGTVEERAVTYTVYRTTDPGILEADLMDQDAANMREAAHMWQFCSAMFCLATGLKRKDLPPKGNRILWEDYYHDYSGVNATREGIATREYVGRPVEIKSIKFKFGA